MQDAQTSIGDPSKPAVVLLGWLHCQHKYLSKYSGYFQSKGYSTHQSICPPIALFWPNPSRRRAWARAILTDVESKFPDHPLYFFSFSNGGAWIFLEMTRLMASDSNFKGMRARTRGCIFDSSPCYMHKHAGAAALAAGFRPALQPLVRAAFQLLALLSVALQGDYAAAFWQQMQCFDVGAPELYLYSADDPLCDAGKLRELISHRLGRGARASSHCWPTSRHVAHAMVHREQYWQLVEGFMQQAGGC